MALDYLVIRREAVWGWPGTDAEDWTWTRLLPLQRHALHPDKPSWCNHGPFHTAHRFETRRAAEAYIKAVHNTARASGTTPPWLHVLAIPMEN